MKRSIWRLKPWRWDLIANINIDQLASEIARGLKEYSQDIVRGINTKSEATAQNAAKALKEKSPKRFGKYAKGWKVKTEKFHGEPDTHTLYNGKYYWLTHLLEFGHAKASGGRVEAQPHISVVEEEVIETFLNEVEEVVQNGST